MKEKINIIIDTDPGVDDLIADIMALYEERLNVLLFTTVSGNIEVDLSTRNLLYTLEYLKKDIPVAKGADKPLKRERKDARFIHGKEGMGNHYPTIPTKTVIEDDAVEAMYKTILEHKNDITILLLGPQTNMANLLMRHPDVEKMISRVIYMGASDYNQEERKGYISFNISSDPEAFQIVLNSKIPLAMIPSKIGRESHLHETQVEMIKENKVVGPIMYDMLTGYWEPGYKEKVVAMNDSCAIYYLLHPELFETKKTDIELDLEELPGKTIFNYQPNGRVDAIVKIDVEKFHELFFSHLNAIQ